MPDKAQKFEIRDSNISGQGLFALDRIKAGEIVVIWNPKVLTKQEAEKLPESEYKHYTYPDEDKILWMQPPERFMNHSCEPNTHVVNKSDVASRDIELGEEITSDYIDLETENFICNCGYVNCRGKKN